jgi:hypothetical protein
MSNWTQINLGFNLTIKLAQNQGKIQPRRGCHGPEGEYMYSSTLS